ncbi:MAG: hypothetical protein JST22_08820 [Bacteroidetes bacterium]|nr:hypothetical protein [Bacteroidota bacterium]
MALALLCALCIPFRAAAQIHVAGNQYITANVSSASSAGRFWITSGPANGSYRLLFGSNLISTSNVIFKVSDGGTDHYFSNIPLDYPVRPKLPDGVNEVDFTPYDSIHASPDTIALGWNDIGGFGVVMRFIPEKPSSPYQNGADMRLEFSYRRTTASGNATLGIFLMLDSYSAQAGGINGVSTIVTDRNYFAIHGRGRSYSAGRDTLPTFYHAGDPLYEDPLNYVMAVHRLSPASHGGVPLTPPSYFAVGDLEVLRETLWAADSAALAGTPLEDCATITRWDNLRGDGIVRTAFGSADRNGNNFYNCRDSSLFVVMRTVRLVEQTEAGGPYAPSIFDVDLWLANTQRPDSQLSATIVLDPPPARTGLVIDASTPSARKVNLPVGGVSHLTWRMNVDPAAKVVQSDVPLSFRYMFDSGQAAPFHDICAPVITVRGVPESTDDVMPPVIAYRFDSTIPNFHIYDRHAGYVHDTGIDTVFLVPGGSYNTEIRMAQLHRCDTSYTATVVIGVVDVHASSRYLLAVYDCRGNVAYDSNSFIPSVPDEYPPVVERLDSTGTSWTWRAYDHHVGYVRDSGLRTVKQTAGSPAENMEFEVTKFAQCDTSAVAIITLRVTDSTLPGRCVFEATDCGDNRRLDSVIYVPRKSGVESDGVVAHQLHIAWLRPQPLYLGRTSGLEVELAGGLGGSLRAELAALDGTIAARWVVENAGTLCRFDFPADTPSGVYTLVVRGVRGEDRARVVVIR